jgi:prepilin-type N-terminal cleavage/methylation domain-containing protein
MRSAFTLLELLIVCAIIGIAAAIAAPVLRPVRDSLAVEAAARDVLNAFAMGRLAALRHGGAELRLDTLGVEVRARGNVLYARNVADAHGVRMRATPAVVRYAATGLATGLSNGTIIMERGRAADTVLVSRLGRARRTAR